jgi:hypothetical protein
VVSTAKAETAKLDDVQATPLRAVILSQMLERDHSMGEALKLQVSFRRRLVVEQEDSALPGGEVLLQRENLTAEAQRITRQQSHLG